MTLMLMNRTTSLLLARWNVWTKSGSHTPMQNTVLRGHTQVAPARSLATLATLGRDHRFTR